LRKLLANFKALVLKVPLNMQDYSIMAGAVMVFYGIHLVYPPAAFIVIGSGLIYMGLPGKR